MKLVFLSHDGNCNGGAQKCLLDLLKGIRLKYPDSQIYVIFPYEGDLMKMCLPYIDGYKVVLMPWWLQSGNKTVGLRRKLKFIRKARKPIKKIMCYLREIDPDYGITNTIVMPYLAVACRILGIRHNWFIHEVPTNTWNDNRFVFNNKNIQKLIDHLSHRVFVTSDYAKLYYQHNISMHKLIVINQAVELDIPASVRTISSHRYTILLVGAFDSNKGQLELLEAVNKIVVGGKDIFCLLVGSDLGYMDTCKEYVTLNKLENNVLIVPFATDIWKYYYQANVLVSCSFLETFGRVAVEAQKCGLPVILSNVGANPERIQDGVNGLLYGKGNVNDLVDKIELMRDECRRSRFVSQIDKANLAKYSVDIFTSQFYDFLKS